MSWSFCFASLAIALLSAFYTGCAQLPEINIHISTSTTTTQSATDSPPAASDALENAPEIAPEPGSQDAPQSAHAPNNSDRQAAATILELVGQTSIVSDRAILNNSVWQRALEILRQHPSIRNGRGTKISLGRVFWEDAQPGERVQLVGGKLTVGSPTFR